MAATKEQKQLYTEALKEPKVHIEEIKKEIKGTLLKKNKSENIVAYYCLELSMLYLEEISVYINMNDASMEYLEVKNTAFLESARKEFYKAVQELEEIVGTDIERPLAENKDYLGPINHVSIRNILHLSRRLLYVFDTLKDKIGEGSKWKWSFVDIHVRIATLVKNLVNFSELEKYRNFKSEFFKDREELLKLVKITLEDAAKEARNKYEMSTKAPEDIRRAVELLTTLRNIHALYGERSEAQKTKTVIDALMARLESEEKKEDQQKGKKKK